MGRFLQFLLRVFIEIGKGQDGAGEWADISMDQWTWFGVIFGGVFFFSFKLL
jgi:hypothetical protein